MESNIYFQPFVGTDYANGGIFGERIMVLGESHYITDDSKSPSFTNSIVKWYLNPNERRKSWMPTFVKFERSLVGAYTDQEMRVKIWNSVLYYNYLQVPMGGPREAGTYEDYQQASKAFFEVLDKYLPKYLIVWGYRLRDHLPTERWEDGSVINVDGQNFSIGYYALPDGKKVKVLAVHHPSVGYSWDFWHRVISEFLK